MSDDIKLTDFIPDARNANKGTERGSYMLRTSLQKLGAGRSVLVDKHGNIIAGNKTVESAVDIGLEDVIVVPSDGTKVVVVQRTDLDLNDEKARQLAYADNRVSEVSYDLDAAVLASDLEAGLDLSDFFYDSEFNDILDKVETMDFDLGSATEENPPAFVEEGEEPEAIQPPASHVRMVYLFFNDSNIDKFNDILVELAKRYETETPTDTVWEAVNRAYTEGF